MTIPFLYVHLKYSVAYLIYIRSQEVYENSSSCMGAGKTINEASSTTVLWSTAASTT